MEKEEPLLPINAYDEKDLSFYISYSLLIHHILNTY